VRESHCYIKDMINQNIDDVIDSMIPIESILKEYISNVFTSHTKDNPKTIETVEPEAPGRVLDHNDLGLDSFDTQGGKSSFDTPFDTPINDEFGAGKGDNFDKLLSTGQGGDDFANDLDVGKDPQIEQKFDFKDDETDIFSSAPPKHVVKDDSDPSPFKSAFEDAKEDPVFKPLSSAEGDIDPFKSSGDDIDPFKSSGGDDIDPFKSSGGGGGGGGDVIDPFKSTDDIPSPPELEKDGIFSEKPDEINFFDEVP
jgi:hypothetical protein